MNTQADSGSHTSDGATSLLQRAVQRLQSLEWPRTGYLTVRRQKALLRRGLYVRDGAGVWRHWRQPLPPHLEQTKARAGSEWLAGGSALQIAKQLIKRLILALHPRFFFSLRKGRFDYPIILARGQKGAYFGCILIDPDAGYVAQTSPHGSYSNTQIRLRKKWAQHISSPAFSVRDKGRLALETFVSGHRLLDASTHIRTAAIRSMISDYSNLCGSEAHSNPADLTARIPDFGIEDPIARQLMETASASDFLTFLKQSPLIPSPADPHHDNIIVGGERDYWIIDVFPLRFFPSFLAPVFFLWYAPTPVPSPEPLIRDYFSGVFDRELSQLLKTSGFNIRLSEETRSGLIATSLLVMATQHIPEDRRLDDRYIRIVRRFALRSAAMRKRLGLNKALR